MDWLNIFKEYGLLGLVVGSVIILLFLVVKWTLSTTKEILAQAAKERESWHKAIGDITQAMEKHDEKASERGKYVREEHKEMITILQRMNGH